MKLCGCKGQRFCLLCREDLISNRSNSKRSRPYVYCSSCVRRAFRLDLEDHQFHLNVNLVESKDYVNIDGVFVCDEAIDEEVENRLVRRIDEDLWICSQSGRKKQDFGK